MVVQFRRTVTGLTATLRGPAPRTRTGTSLVIEVSAEPTAKAGTYQIALVAGGQRIAVPTSITVASAPAGPTVTSGSPSQLVLEAAGPQRTVVLTGSQLSDLTDVYVERNGTRLTGRFDLRLASSTDPSTRQVLISALANAGPPWGTPLDLIASSSQLGGPAVAIRTPVALTVPAPPVDLVISACTVDSTRFNGRVARATLTNQGSQGVSFQSGQIVARFSGAGPARTATAQSGGQYVAAGGSVEASASLDLSNVPGGQLAVTMAADPDRPQPYST